MCRYVDISREDLNISFEDIKQRVKREDILIAPSLYGNPADICNIESWCRENDVYLIDDAAQAFGSSLNGKNIGSFGDAGLFSFSAGKPTIGGMGSFFWSENEFQITHRTRHHFYHRLVNFNFWKNRYGDYRANRLYRNRGLWYFQIVLGKIFDVDWDNYEKIDFSYNMRSAYANLHRWQQYRNEITQMFSERLHEKPFHIIRNVRGISNPVKVVMICDDERTKALVKEAGNRANYHFADGYKLLDSGSYPIAENVFEKIIEIPIHPDKKLMNRVVKELEKI